MDEKESALQASKELRRAMQAEEKAAHINRQLLEVERMRLELNELRSMCIAHQSANQTLLNQLQEQDERIEKSERVLQKAEWWGRGVLAAGAASIFIASQIEHLVKWLKAL